jgi:hypothetical protein
MSAIPFKLFALVAGHVVTLLIELVRWPAPALNLCKMNLLGDEEFPQINEKTSWERSPACSQLDQPEAAYRHVES